eukprot:Rmarinus@m.3636
MAGGNDDIAKRIVENMQMMNSDEGLKQPSTEAALFAARGGDGGDAGDEEASAPSGDADTFVEQQAQLLNSSENSALAAEALRTKGVAHAAVWEAMCTSSLAIPRLVSVVSWDHKPTAQLEALLTLGQFVESARTGASVVAENGAFPTLVTLLRASDMRVREHAARILAACATTDDNRDKVVEAGAVQPLLELIDPSPLEETQDVVLAAATAVMNISRTGCQQGPLVVDAIPNLTKLLSSPLANMRRVSAGAIANIVSSVGDAALASKQLCGKSLPDLIQLLENDHCDIEVKQVAALAMANVIRDAESTCTEKGLAPVLRSLSDLMSHDDPLIAERAVRAMFNLTKDNVFVQPRAVCTLPVLTSSLQSPRPRVRKHAAGAIANISKCLPNVSSRPLEASIGGTAPALTRLLDDRDVRFEALRALTSITSHDANKKHHGEDYRQNVISLDGFQRLVRVIHEETHPPAHDAASLVIWNLCRCKEGKRVGVDHLDVFRELLGRLDGHVASRMKDIIAVLEQQKSEPGKGKSRRRSLSLGSKQEQGSPRRRSLTDFLPKRVSYSRFKQDEE